MTPTDSQAARMHEELARVLALLEKATPGEWFDMGSVMYCLCENPEPHSCKRLPLVNRFSAKFQNDNRIASTDEMNANAAACAAALMFLRKHGAHIAETFKETPNG